MTTWQDYITEKCTDDQKSAILAKEPLVVVSAGAGAGKTQTLAQRFAYLVAENPDCKMEQILVLTFTIKAAQEMRERIENQLHELYGKYKDELPHLKERILQIEDATISTLDAFAMKITREAGLNLDIDPTFNITSAPFEEIFWSNFANALDEMSKTKLKRLAAKNEIWQNRVDELFALPDFSRLISKYTPEKLTQTIRNAVSLFSNKSAQTNFEWLWNFNNSAQLAEYQSQPPYATLLEDTWDKWHNIFFEFDSVFAGKASFLEFRANWLEAEKTEENMRTFARQLADKSVIKSVTAKKHVDFFMEHFGVTPTEYRDKLAEQLPFCQKQTEAEIELCSALNKLAAFGWFCFEQEKHNANCLSIQDLMLYAGQVVASSDSYKNRYKYIMVDEFQDTNPLQNELLKQLWKGADAENPNSLFIVGDLKQSIYRFRHAKPSLFKDYITLAQTSGDKGCYICLRENFRSAKPLLEIINNTFGQMWEKTMGALEVPYESLEYPNSSEIKLTDGNAVDIFTTAKGQASKDNPTEKRNIDTARAELYASLAEYIKKSIVQNPKLSWKDFTILVPSRTPYKAIETAFDYAQIPYALCSAKEYYGRDEIIILINFLTLLANPDDSFALAAWLASPFADIENELPQMLCEAKKRSKHRQKPNLSEVVAEKHPEILIQLERYRNIAKLRGVPAVLMELQKNNDFLKNYEPSQRRKVSVNLEKLIEAALEYEQTKGNSISGCSRYLQKAVATGQQKVEPDLVDETQDKVRIMTTHASKGLQFTVTILAETDSEPRLHYDTLLISPTLGILARKLPDYLDKNESPLAAVAWHDKLEKDATVEEKERCWYVAMTRAKQKLLLCGIDKQNKDGLSRKGFLKEFTELNGQENSQIAELKAKDYTAAQVNRANERTEITAASELPQISEAMLSRITASAYATLCWCPYAYRRSFRQGLKMQWETQGNGETQESGDKFGTLIHSLIKQWDFQEETLHTLFASASYRLSAKQKEIFSKDTVQKEALRLLKLLANSSVGKQFAALNKTLQKETTFRAKIGDLLMVGAIDLYWQDEAGFHICDWKTTAASDMTEAYYMPQLDFYAAALWLYQKQNGQDTQNIDTRLIHLDAPDDFKIKTYSDVELEQIAHNITEKAKTACGREFPAATGKCSLCPWKTSCDKAYSA